MVERGHYFVKFVSRPYALKQRGRLLQSPRQHTREVWTMLKPASLKGILRYPVTTSVAAAALVVSVSWWSGRAMDWLVMNVRVWEKWELWRALTSTLPHVNFTIWRLICIGFGCSEPWSNACTGI